MRGRLRDLVGNRAVQQAGDIVLALVLAVTSVGGVLSGEPSWGSTRSVALVLALASTVPVVWRARRPVLAAAIVFAANGGCVIAAAPYEASLQPFVALSLVAYSLGSRAEGRSAKVAPPVLAALSATAFVVAVAVGQTSGHVIPSFVWLCATWAVGRVVRALRLRADELEVALRELEQQRELQAQAALAIERGRIARELHDVIAHNVSMMVVQAAAASRVLEGEQPDVRTALEAIEGSGRQTVEEMRRLIGVVRADDGLALAPQPTLGDLQQLTEKLRQAGLPVELRTEGEPAASLPPGIDLCAYRIVQEALTNTLKHAGRAQATVTVRYSSGAVELEIVDDGDATGNGGGSGNGLIGMRERALLWGGELHSGHLAGGGWAVTARLPLRTP